MIAQSYPFHLTSLEVFFHHCPSVGTRSQLVETWDLVGFTSSSNWDKLLEVWVEVGSFTPLVKGFRGEVGVF